MKKSILVLTGLFVAMLFAVNSVQAQNTQTFNLSATVEEYVEVNPSFEVMSASRTINPGDAGSADLESFNYVGKYQDVVYANCPMEISVEGDNPANDGEPILARDEVNGNGFDRLQTNVDIRPEINGTYNNQGPGWQRAKFIFTSDPEGAATGNWLYGKTATFSNAPHDGEVSLGLYFDAALPHESPDFGTDNTWNQSADAGDYSANVVVTYSALGQ